MLRRLAGVALAAVALAGACGGDEEPVADLTVLTFNACGNVCAGGGPAPAAFVAGVARRTGASVLLLQEVCRDQAEEVGRRLGAEVHHVATLTGDAGGRNRCADGRYGIAVVTTASVQRRYVLPLPNPGLGRTQLEERRIACVDTADLTACTTHLARASNDAAAHRAQVEAFTAAAGGLAGGRVVIGGDLNDGAGAFRRLGRSFVSAPSDPGAVDRVFATRARFEVVGESAHRCRCSDHRARVIRIAGSGSVT